MPKQSQQLSRSERFRFLIAAFIEARKEAKLKGKEDDADTESKYDYETWLADAARRVSQIQIVTHVLKATHPDARGSSLNIAPSSLPPRAEIGSHLLGKDCAEDVVGNAAALDVYKLLKLEVEGRRLLDWMQDGDTDLRNALCADAELASSWMEAFSGVVRGDAVSISHEAAKQVYWLMGGTPANNDEYHLLQPMFSSSLTHAVHGNIQDARFGEANKLARKAFRAKEPSEEHYRDYRNLVVRKLGGTKPQNVSQLNSERGGVNYLLASLPPKWRPEHPLKLLQVDSAMDRLASLKGIRSQIKLLADFLLTDPPANDNTRSTRKRIEQELGAQLALFAVETWARSEPGWTRDPACVLPLCEKLWLDPERADLPVRGDPSHPEQTEDDLQFNAALTFGDWPDEVAGRFANWVNKRLHKAGLSTVGDAEHQHWARQAIIDAAWPIPIQRRAPTGGDA
jgi:CRISPR-associated protein Csy1